jgi:serine/threonine-protein kinase
MVDARVSPDGVPPLAGVDGERPAQRPQAAEHWKRVKAVFLEALEQPESEKSAWLAGACAGDAALEAEVASLLASQESAASFLETPAARALGIEALPDSVPSPRLEPGTRLGSYEITGFLSAGGMGEVYRARHTVLDRQVAIKTVRPQLTDPVARHRLIREARHAATLAHPNICTIYEVSEADGMPFIVMGYVDGHALSDVVRAALPSVSVVLDYGVQVADALAHAHKQRIVHCDLKSSNVVVDTSGRAVVLDFGLAKRLTTSSLPADSTVTIQGALAGTLSHMAPEVLRGGRPDERSDIWSLGVLLYELATGALPFQGRTPFETTSAILNEIPRPIGSRVPLALRLVIERCLLKDPRGRYQDVAQVRAALDAIRRRRGWPMIGRLLVIARRRTLYVGGVVVLLVAALAAGGRELRERLGGVSGGRISTVAFLPFENATASAETDYYAAGLTAALMEQLSTAADVRVISPTSTARAALTAGTPAEAARILGAEALIEGRLRQASDRIAVDVRLVDASGGRVLWSDMYERSAQQALALQADVIRALTAEVRLTVRPGARERLATVRAVNPEAYEAYLKGRYQWNQRTPGSLRAAITHFTRAIELDPTYAPAHAALADCYNQFATVLVGTGSPSRYRPLAKAAAIRALQIDPNSAEAHAALGYVYHYDWQWDDAEREFRRAIELNPSFALARVWYGNLLMSRRRMDEALAQVNAARELDPFSLVINTNLGWVLTRAGRPADAVAVFTRTLELDSTYVQARLRLVDALFYLGRFDEAREQAQRLVASSGRSPMALKTLAMIEARAGRTDAVRDILTELEVRARTDYVPPGVFAWVFIMLGDNDSAIAWMTRAFEERSNAMAYVDTDPAWDGLRNDPRFQAMVVTIGLR